VSTFRKTVLTTAIIGAGLASTTGAAFANDCSHDGGHKAKHESSSSGCSNSFVGKTGDSKAALGILDSAQGAIGANVCDVVSHNNLLNGNSVTVAGTTLPTLPTLPGGSTTTPIQDAQS
jgi:hypothetical protein